MEPKKLFPWLMMFLLFFSLWTLQFSNTPVIFFKHVLGIVGTFLIFGAEILYTARKKKQIKFGRVKIWFQSHIVIGIVGPILILFHAGFDFYKFSGIAMFLTLLVATSGFFGRYVYRLIPRTIKGGEQSLDELRASQEKITTQLKELLGKEVPGIDPSLFVRENYKSKNDLPLLFEVSLNSYRKRNKFNQQLKKAGTIHKQAYWQLSNLFFQRTVIEKQIRMFKSAKNLLKRWKILHIPLTIMLFMAINIHIISIFYYGRI